MKYRFRSRLVSPLDGLDTNLPNTSFVYEFGLVRVQGVSLLEVIMGKGARKYIFCDHLCKSEQTWVYFSQETDDDLVFQIASQIASDEKYGEYLGSFRLEKMAQVNFVPRDGLLPSIAQDKLRKGYAAVVSGNWPGALRLSSETNP